MSWFDEQGFVIEREPRGARRVDGPVNTTMPVGAPVAAGGPTASAPPGMTIGGAMGIVTDPTNSRLSSGGAASGGTEPYSDDRFLQIVHQFPPTYEGAKQAAAELDRVFGAGVVKLIDHPTKLDKFELPGGRIADQMYAAGSSAARWNDSVTLERGGHGGGGAAGSLGGMMSGNWQAGMDPSYEWRFKEGQKALERSAASKGTLLTGGTLKALAAYGQGLASTEFGNIFGRNYQLAGLGLNAAGQAAGAGTSYSGQVGNMAANQAQNTVDLTTGAANAQSAASAVNGANWGNRIGQLGQIIAPDAAGWLRGGKGVSGGRPTIGQLGRPVAPPSYMAATGVGPGTFPGWADANPWGGSGDGY